MLYYANEDEAKANKLEKRFYDIIGKYNKQILDICKDTFDHIENFVKEELK